MAMYRTDGSLDWVLGQGGSGLDSFHGVGILPDGPDQESIFVTGEFGDTVLFGTGGGDEVQLTAAGDLGDPDIVLLRLDVQTDVN
jgi:hypothetical protein